jgi:hypothetical protein
MVGDRYLAFGGLLQMSSQNLISLGPVVNKSYAIAFLFGVTAFVKNFVNDWSNLGTLIKRHLGQPGHSRCLEMSENFMSIAEGFD